MGSSDNKQELIALFEEQIRILEGGVIMWLNTLDTINYLKEHINNDVSLKPEAAELLLNKLYRLQGMELLQQIVDPESYEEYWDWTVVDVIDENRELKELLKSLLRDMKGMQFTDTLCNYCAAKCKESNIIRCRCFHWRNEEYAEDIIGKLAD